MIEISDLTECCGCWACESICPKHCITMQEDNEGFCYPYVEKKDCINCGLCIKACPIKKEKPLKKEISSYIVQHKSLNVRRHSTSGGFFTGISKYAIERGGIVFGAAFDSDMQLCHSYGETLSDCEKFRGSKYVQSRINKSFLSVKDFLIKNKIVVFSGTPCQIAGLKAFLGKDYENLITVDLVCHGVPSPLLLRKYLSYYEELYNSKVINFLSRDKFYGYNYSTTTLVFADKKKEYHKGKESDIMLRFYFDDICSRPSCYDCHFKTINRNCDFTIFDCWDAKSFSKMMNSEGATNVFVHTNKGKAIFEDIKHEFIWCESDFMRMIEKDGSMIENNVPLNPLRKDFFADINTLPFIQVKNKYLKNSFKKRIIIFLKPFLYKIGVFNLYMKFK